MIKIFVTGGTFDKDYDEKNGKLYFKDTHMSEILNLGRSKVEVNIETLMMIDSLDMKETDRRLIVDSCESTNEKNIIVTHGTDTMTETAKKVGEKNLQKTIVLTGAMIPYKFGTSDGLFNIASALAYVQTLSSGVYVAMNGRVFTYDNVIKNKETGVFEEIK
ncbi:asparaginase [Candidatus Marinimicrobia bacterium]|nr:asparaginase [Candidatus Neomarinimicrobiota bacterium]MDA9991845.1 asparaginase [Candidatus Neomarinimicrobiota bacterium]MDC3333792.1 asparaginase [Candidatus Neomarinimicrobiota bacterium]|tara:strand:+ start:212 stop:697 length:486 start_codon:yes stop_codon:yes gene_type:complete